MFLGAAAMVCVRMSIKESINERSSFAVSLYTVAKILRYVTGVIVGIIGGRSNVAVNKNGRSGLVSEADQRHVPVADREMGKSSWHNESLSAACDCVLTGFSGSITRIVFRWV